MVAIGRRGVSYERDASVSPKPGTLSVRTLPGGCARAFLPPCQGGEFRVKDVQRYLAHKKPPPLQDHHRALGIYLLLGPKGARILMSEVTL